MESVEDSGGDGSSKKPTKGPRACGTCALAKCKCEPGSGPLGKCERCERLKKKCTKQIPAPPRRRRKDRKLTRVAELERRLEALTEQIAAGGGRAGAGGSSGKSETPGSASTGEGLENHHHSSLGGSELDGQQPLPAISPDYHHSTSSGPKISVTNHHFTQAPWNGEPFEALLPPSELKFSPILSNHQTPQYGHHHHHQHQHHPQHQQTLGGLAVSAAGSVMPDAMMTSASPPSHPSPMASSNASDSIWPEGQEAEDLLQEYRSHMQHLYPFALVPPNLSAHQMKEQRPFFWKGVMVEACHHDGRRQMALGDQLLRDISVAAFQQSSQKGQPSLGAGLDLLQGAQVLLAWYHYNLVAAKTTNLLFLIRSFTASLKFEVLDAQEQKNAIAGLGGQPRSEEALERMRAFAGTYYLVTVAFTTSHCPDQLMPSPYLMRCCKVLITEKSSPDDELVVHLVRVQRVSQHISMNLANWYKKPLKERRPWNQVVENLRLFLHGEKKKVPKRIMENFSMKGHFIVAELLIYEGFLKTSGSIGGSSVTASSLPEDEDPSFRTSPSNGLGNDTPSSHSSNSRPASVIPLQDRLDILMKCVRLVKEYMHARTASDQSDYPRFISMSSFDLTYVFVRMLKLMTLSLPGWDVRTVRREFDGYLERHIKDMEHTAGRRKKRSRTMTGASNYNSPSDVYRTPQGVVGGGGSGMGGSQQGLEREREDPFAQLARKIRELKKAFDQDLQDGQSTAQLAETTAQLAELYEKAPMTLADATATLVQEISQDLGTDSWDGGAMDYDWNPGMWGGDFGFEMDGFWS
ncbi:hypothetical protein QC762_702210 [Podospora pseudocomata]|uniref:Zn(2)-C6 fungal-type domain-containing protein n=1 Tax=Podospora pseudocomata TaxID=2093779 RepID=A0ABR0G330_9PEZI|nr:hypothetical protein QC762_702210 [Podospora pseudocomata]